ncbi:MAG: PIG-L family deacetylase [Chloroflexota bacterium]|nr:PIG-L family deacetylase [Anaerolineae bacterium]
MAEKLKLMCILAHPDDESLGIGGTVAKYAATGVEIHLVTATRGEHGWPWDIETYPGLKELGRRREVELRAAASVLGIHSVNLLNYIDGELDQANPLEIQASLVTIIRQVRPQVIVTFDPNGVYGHPDHIAISQLTTAAVVCAADSCYGDTNKDAHYRVSKLYYLAPLSEQLAIYQTAFGEFVIHVDGTPRRASGWDTWAITTRIDAEAHWQTVWQAVSCHKSQLANFQFLERQPTEIHKQLWGCQTYYRAFSLVNGGREIETDLFDGLPQNSDVER